MKNYIPQNEWVRYAAAQNHVECFVWNSFGGLALELKLVPGKQSPLKPSRGLELKYPWKTIKPEEDGLSVDREEVRQACWGFARDRGNYWDLDELCEVDLAIVGRWLKETT